MLEGTYKGQCRRLTVTSDGSNIQWATSFGGIIPTGVTIRVYVPNKIMLQNPKLPASTDVTYTNSVRASTLHVDSRTFVYDGWGGDNLKPYPTTNLNTIPASNATANYLVQASVNTNKPTEFTTGYGFLTTIKDVTAGYARQTLKSLNATDNYVWERTVKLSDSTATAWLLTSTAYSFTVIDVNSYSYTHPGGLIEKSGYGPVLADGSSVITFPTPFPTQCFTASLIIYGDSPSEACTIFSKDRFGFQADQGNVSNYNALWTAKGN